MTTVVDKAALPTETAALGKPFEMNLPSGATLIRAALDTASGKPVVWFMLSDAEAVVQGDEAREEATRSFIVIMNSGEIPSDNLKHLGMWWESDRTFHLFELFKSG